MIQLKPQEIFTIVRGLEDHTDSGTYYVQAVIRNARTDIILDTINLNDKGDGFRFSNDWDVPADTSGEGFYITIIISVYTDSNYTTKSLDYGDRYDSYLIQERYNPVFGGGGADVNYKKIKKIIQENVVIPEFKQEKVNLSGLFNEIKLLNNAINSIVIPEQKEVDFTEIKKSVDDISNNVKIRPQFEKTDLSLITNKLDEIKIKENIENTKVILNDILERIKSFFEADNKKIYSEISELNQKIKNIPFVAFNNIKEINTKEPIKKFRK